VSGRYSLTAGLVVASGLLAATSARAEGMRNPPDTAAAIGKAGMHAVWVDDASAVFLNPANLVDVPGRQVLVSATVGRGETHFRRAADGLETETRLPWFGLPSAAIAWPFPEQGLSAGLGVNVPFGRQSAWERTGLFQYGTPYTPGTPVYSRLMVLDICPSLAWRVTDDLSVGAGLDVYYGRLHFREYLPPVFGDLADASADGWAFGANAGVTWRFAAGQRLALTCRSPFDLQFDGAMHVSNANTQYGVSPDSTLSTTMPFPMSVSLGYGVQITDTVRAEAEVTWLQYSRFRTLALDAGANNPLLQMAGQSSVPTEWNDCFAGGVGVSWDFAPLWTARAGYQYLQTPQPDRTFMATFLDNSQSLFGLGLGYRRGRQAVDFAVAAGLFNDRKVNGNLDPDYVGKYKFDAQLAVLTYTLGF